MFIAYSVCVRTVLPFIISVEQISTTEIDNYLADREISRPLLEESDPGSFPETISVRNIILFYEHFNITRLYASRFPGTLNY